MLAAGTEPNAFEGATLGEELRVGFGGMRGVDALDLGQEHEQPRTDEHGDLRRERVVVAERDLVGGCGVVLVHDGDDAEPQERHERVTDGDVGGALGEVGRGEQQLRRQEPLRPERLRPRELESHLADRGRGLELRRRPRASCDAELAEAERDRAGGDDADTLLRARHLCDVGGALREELPPHTALPVRDE